MHHDVKCQRSATANEALASAEDAGRDWSIRQGTPDDIPGINRLFAEVFGWTRSDAALAWRLYRNPAGAPIVVVAEAGGRIVGHRALWPTDLRIRGQDVAGAQSVDIMTHPDFRGQGIFGAIAHESFQLASEAGIEILYSFPNRLTLSAGQGLGWSVIGEPATFSRPLRSDAMRRIPRALRPLVSLALIPWPRATIKAFETSTDRPSRLELERLLSMRNADGPGSCQTARTAAWYDWRCAPDTETDYHWATIRRAGVIEAVAVWGRGPTLRNARLADVIGQSPESTAAVISLAIGQAHAAGCSTLDAMTNRPDMRRALSANGFRQVGTVPFRVRSTTTRPLPTFDEFAAWRLFGCDFDVY